MDSPGSGLESKKNPSVGPSGGSVAAQTIPLVTSCTGLLKVYSGNDYA